MIDIVAQIADKLRGLKIQLTPEEKQLLKISDEDIATFMDESLLLTSQEMESALEDIIQEAYQESPQFKALVEADRAKDPQRLSRSSKVISKFLKHLRDSLPQEKAKWIRQNTFEHAHDLMQSVLKKPAVVEKAPVKEEKVELLSREDLGLFGLKPEQITADIKQDDLREPVLYFLNRLKKDGKKIKNEATSKMSDDYKIDYVYRLLKMIRDAKIKARGSLKPFEEKWLGKDIDQLKRVARSIVEKPAPKETPPKSGDIHTVMDQVQNALKRTQEVLNIVNKADFKDAIEKIDDALTTSLPPVNLVEDRIKNIQEEISKLGLSRPEINRVLNINESALTFDPFDVKNVKEEIAAQKSEIDKKKGTMSEDEYKEKMQGINLREKVIENLAAKDLSGLNEAVEDYFETLKSYKDVSDKKLSKEVERTLPNYDRLVEMTENLSRLFNTLSKEEIFNRKWKGRGGRVFREDRSLEVKKVADDGSTPYARKLEQFKGRGISDAIEKLYDFIGDEEEGLPFLRDKLLSIMETRPGRSEENPEGNILNPTNRDFSGNPLGGVGPAMEEFSKKLSSIKNTLKNISIKGKASQAKEVLSWLAQVPIFVKSRAAKKACLFEMIKIAAMRIAEEEKIKGKTPPGGQIPLGSGKGGKPSPSGKAGWIVFRERLTKFGPKALQDFFDEPTFVQDFVEQMEKEGLNTMLLEGGQIEYKDVEPVLEKIIQKATGKKGDLGNILGTKVMQGFKTELDIKKTKKELEETQKRIEDLNEKIVETDKKFIPKIAELARFLRRPFEGVKKHLEEKKPAEVKEAPVKKEKKLEKIEPQPVNRSNYQSVLYNMAKQYGVEWAKKASMEVLSAITPPSEAYKKLLVHKKQIEDMTESIRPIEQPFERARKIKDYLELILNRHDKLEKYVSRQKEKIEADKKTLKNVEDFLASSDKIEDEKETNIAKARGIISKLRDAIDREEEAFEKVRKIVESEKRDIQRYDFEKELQDIKKDIADGKVERLYQIAGAPELDPSKEKRQEIKEKAKEKSRALGYIMDQSTYKNKMNKIMEYKPPRGPSPAPGAPSETFVLPSERLEEYKKSQEEEHRRLEEINRITDEKNKKYQKLKFLEKQVEFHEERKKKLEDIRKRLNLLKDIADVRRYLEENKPEVGSEEYKKNMAAISEKLKTLGLKEGVNVEEMYKKEEKAFKKLEEQMKAEETRISQYYSEAEDLKKELKDKGPITRQQLQDKLQRLKVDRMAIPTSAQLTQADRQKKLVETTQQIKEIEDQLKSMSKEAATDDPGDERTPYEKALDVTGKTPDFMKDIKRPKGWDVLENFFEESKKELQILEGLKAKGKDWDEIPEETRKDILDRTEDLEKIIPMIDEYKKQIVEIAGEKVPLAETVMRFEDILHEYTEKYRRYVNQRDTAIEKTKKLRQHIDLMQDLFDPETGEFKGLGEEEVENLKNIFLRMLYKQLDGYWSTRVGKDINVFGERDTEWYNNVYRTFRNLADSRSNRKLLSVLNKYKQETRSDFDDIKNRKKSEELIKRRDELLKKYRALGQDPSRSETIKDLNTRIQTLKKQEEQIKTLFNNMAQVAQIGVHEELEDAIRSGIKGEEPKSKTDLDKKLDKKMEETAEYISEHMKEIAEAAKASESAEKILEEARRELPKEEPAEKTSYRFNRNFDLRLLYDPIIQDKIASMVGQEISH